MLDIIIKCVEPLQLSGIKLDLLVSFIMTCVIVLFVIVVGRVIDIIETFLMDRLSILLSPKWASFIMNRLTFVGTILHELAHAIVVWLTGAKVIKIRLFELAANGRLGHVEFALRGPKWKQLLQLSLGSCAPVLFGLLEEYILIRIVLFHELDLKIQILLWYFIISIFVHMSMSKEDLKHYIHGLLVVIPIIMLLCMAFQYFL